MTNSGDSSIRTGDISGTGIAVGHGASATVTITQEGRDEIRGMLEELRKEIQKSRLSDETKGALLNRAVPEMEKSIAEKDPRPGLERGLSRINDRLEDVGVAAEKVSGIVETVKKIAQTAGIVVKAAAPFLAALL